MAVRHAASLLAGYLPQARALPRLRSLPLLTLTAAAAPLPPPPATQRARHGAQPGGVQRGLCRGVLVQLHQAAGERGGQGACARGWPLPGAGPALSAVYPRPVHGAWRALCEFLLAVAGGKPASSRGVRLQWRVALQQGGLRARAGAGGGGGTDQVIQPAHTHACAYGTRSRSRPFPAPPAVHAAQSMKAAQTSGQKVISISANAKVGREFAMAR